MLAHVLGNTIQNTLVSLIIPAKVKVKDSEHITKLVYQYVETKALSCRTTTLKLWENM